MENNRMELTNRQKAEWIFQRMCSTCKDVAPKDFVTTAVTEIENALEAVIRGDESYFEGFKSVFD